MSSAATQIFSREFDGDFFRLPVSTQKVVQQKIDAMDSGLSAVLHYRMVGTDTFRLPVGDYRVFYRFDVTKGEIYLIAMGHRREIYRQ